MRNNIRTMIERARRAEDQSGRYAAPNPNELERLAGEAIRFARLATAAHLAENAGLVAETAAAWPPVPAESSREPSR